jgi:hypothetical protein
MEGEVWRYDDVGGRQVADPGRGDRRLKKLLAEAVVDNSVLKDLLRKN